MEEQSKLSTASGLKLISQHFLEGRNVCLEALWSENFYTFWNAIEAGKFHALEYLGARNHKFSVSRENKEDEISLDSTELTLTTHGEAIHNDHRDPSVSYLT